MRTVLLLLLALANGLPSLDDYARNTTAPNGTIHHNLKLRVSYNYTADPDSKKLTSFFKLAHSRITPRCDIKTVASSLVPLYVQLCASVPDCASAVRELCAAHQNELQIEMDRMDRLHLVLHRVMRIANRMLMHRGLWRTGGV
jgi:hypothetical protein